MKVYILIGRDDYEPQCNEVLSVYSSLESAQKAKANLEKTLAGTYRSVWICPETVLD